LLYLFYQALLRFRLTATMAAYISSPILRLVMGFRLFSGKPDTAAGVATSEEPKATNTSFLSICRSVGLSATAHSTIFPTLAPQLHKCPDVPAATQLGHHIATTLFAATLQKTMENKNLSNTFGSTAGAIESIDTSQITQDAGDLTISPIVMVFACTPIMSDQAAAESLAICKRGTCQ